MFFTIMPIKYFYIEKYDIEIAFYLKKIIVLLDIHPSILDGRKFIIYFYYKIIILYIKITIHTNYLSHGIIMFFF